MYHIAADVIEPPTLTTVTPAKSSKKRSKRKQVKNACVNCQKACKRCDEGRPCQRCVKLGLTATCRNSPRKERQKGVKRGPYKKRQRLEQQQQDQESSLVTELSNEWYLNTDHAVMLGQPTWKQSCPQLVSEILSPLSTSDQSDHQGLNYGSSSTWSSSSPSLSPMSQLYSASTMERGSTATPETETIATAPMGMFDQQVLMPEIGSVTTNTSWMYPVESFSTSWPFMENQSQQFLCSAIYPVYHTSTSATTNAAPMTTTTTTAAMEPFGSFNLHLPNFHQHSLHVPSTSMEFIF
ncbi:hypothetical protein EC973_005550 [Apophysomyces ossiformis]|uniref:Zn(2)-C6 fungal-type domain-containing protein n=1 Tax=Apophysomyces ossiformis TaxID=679940 RepID=A0A8H7BK81_9FUNG|nr:hypothetical protein EC973_005550 [Apophysomyces ossiformis]